MTARTEPVGAAGSPGGTPETSQRRQWCDPLFFLMLLVAVVVRLEMADARPFVHDERNTAIPLAMRISFDAETRYLPIRAVNHPALPAYVVKASSAMFGTTPLAYRALHVGLGAATIVLVYLLARLWFGRGAARWAATLLAFNEYFLDVSSRATAHAPQLFFLALALYAWARFLRSQRPAPAYLAGFAVGMAFYAKEHSALLMPLFLLTLLLPGYRHWLRRPHVYALCLLFFVVVAPDVAWNLTRDADGGQVTYGRHLQRIGGIGLSPYPLAFYLRPVVASAHALLTGREFDDNTPEYASMNPALGLLVLAAVMTATWRCRTGEVGRVFLLAVFWGIFGFFTLVRRGSPDGLDPVSWVWVDVTMIPAVALAGGQLMEMTGRARRLAWTAAAAVVVYAGLLVVR